MFILQIKNCGLRSVKGPSACMSIMNGCFNKPYKDNDRLIIRQVKTDTKQIKKSHLAFASQSMLVKQILCHLVVGSIHFGEVGDIVTQFLDGLHLLTQVMGLQEVAELMGAQKMNPVSMGKS